MLRYLLDTNIASYILKRSSAAVLRRLESAAVNEIAISVITKAELLYGVEIAPVPERYNAAVQEFLRFMQVLDFPDAAALEYARIRASLKRTGQLIGGNDLLLAAHARALGLTLVTNNTREFCRVSGLVLEDWTQDFKEPAS